jgi:RNA polymerase subunit RPABC4/transcription elongation factor Spt4
MEAVIARSVQVLAALGGAYLVALWFVLVIWTFRDIETRSRSVITQIFSTLLVVLFFVPGVLLYLILRPKETLDFAFQRSLEEEYLLQDLEELPLCRSCQHYVEDDYMLCPHCQTQLRDACVACSRLVDLRWNVCPYCGAGQSRAVEVPKEKVLEPAARWVAPAALRRRALRQLPGSVSPELGAGEVGELPQVAGTLSTVAAVTQAPVRLFDRRKTRESARLNGYRRPVAVNGFGAPLTTAALVDRFGRKLDQAEPALSTNGDESPSSNGHHDPVMESTDEGTIDELVRLPVTSDRAGD